MTAVPFGTGAKPEMRETLKRIEKLLGLQPRSVNELTRRSGFVRSTVLGALRELRDVHGLACELAGGWIHGNAVNGRESREGALARVFAPIDELVNATLARYSASVEHPGPITFDERMLEACTVALNALQATRGGK